MGITIEDAKQFIQDVEDERKVWLRNAERSWAEIKKDSRVRSQSATSPNTARRKVRFPLWRSTFKIRQPLHYARTPQVICKDTTGGDDPVGRTAAILKERLWNGIRRTFELDPVMEAVRDDVLATNVGACRAFYECDEVEVPKKCRCTKVEGEDGSPAYVDETGEPVDPNRLQQDEEGYYIETTETVEVENERVYLDHVLYSDIYLDPDAKRWSKVRRVAFSYEYSRSEFRQMFGSKALATFSEDTYKDHGKKRKSIKVFELWNLPEREVVWFAENGSDFLKPVKLQEEKAEGEIEGSDPYELKGFFPCARPMIWNAPTDSLLPVLEWWQLQDIIEDIHNLFTQLFVITKAIRPRLIFDNNVDALQQLINEAGTADAIGVSNLTQTLSAGGGDLGNMVKYLPINEMVQALENAYKAFEQRLNLYYQLTGISDLMRGQTDGVERTYGEQQLKAKFGMSQAEEGQRDMQRYARDSIELLCDLALKCFADSTFEQYIVPSTLDPEDQQRYEGALELLKSDRVGRFRVELETDSTLAINEEYDKAARVEIANVISKAIESSAKVAQDNAALGVVELKLLKHLIRGFRQGKLFEDEVTAALDDCIQKTIEAEQQPQPQDPEQARVQIEGQKLQLDAQKFTAEQQGKMVEVQSKQNKDAADVQVKVKELELEGQRIQLEYAKLQQDLQKAQADYELKALELQILREKNNIEAQKAGNDALLKQNRLEIDAQIAASETRLAEMAHSLEAYKVQLDEKEKYMTEYRLQQESQMKALDAQLRAQQQAQAAAVPQVQMPPIINQIMPAKPTIKKSRVIRDPVSGEMVGSETMEVPVEEPTL